MAEFIPKNNGPAVIKAASSNTISDKYRDSLAIMYQFIGSSVPSISFELGNRTFSTPIMAGAVGGTDRGEGGSLTYAKAVAEAGSIFWFGFHDNASWRKILDAGVPAVRVIKPLESNERYLEEVAYDTEHGAVAYAIDLSHGLTVYGEKDAQEEQFSSKTLDDLKAFAEASPLPFIIKDIMSVHDALLAVEAGADGIILSGHNNRFPCAIPPLKLLPMVRMAVGDKLKIFVDGGLNNGYDVFKALALGADGTLCARQLVAVYAKEGPEGLTQKILEMTAELRGAMANTGSPDLQHINHDSVIEF